MHCSVLVNWATSGIMTVSSSVHSSLRIGPDRLTYCAIGLLRAYVGGRRPFRLVHLVSLLTLLSHKDVINIPIKEKTPQVFYFIIILWVTFINVRRVAAKNVI